MNIKTTFLTLVLLIGLGLSSLTAQNPNWNPNLLGTCAATCAANNLPVSNSKGGGNNTINNGNANIATIYTMSACGLNYVLGSVKTGKRYFPPGPNQPAAIVIAGLPVCKTILKAYLYVGGSGNGINFSTTLVNPALTSSVFPMTPIGNDVDKCWGYAGTYNYRADVTALITGNGNYNVSGIPTSISTPGNDMDGASLVIIYSDPTQAYTGNIVIGDGCQVNASTFGILNNTLSGFNACGNSTFAQCFYIISDLQNIMTTSLQMNNAAYNFFYPAASNQWWDDIVGPATAVTAGQSTCLFGSSNTADCYNIVTEGLYFQTNCNVCSASGLTVTTLVTSTCTIGSATAVVTGGTGPYTYTWTPSALNTSVITNVAPGNYTVTVKDATGCFTGTALAVIPANSTTLAVNSATICSGHSVTLIANGGNTYTWTPAATLSSPNGSAVVASPLATTVYTVTGTNTLGCTGTAVSTVVVNPLPIVTVNNPTACVNTPFTLTATGGTAYAWTGPNAFVSALQNPAFAVASASLSGNYTVMVTSATGCTNTAVAAVSVVPLPTLSIVGTNTMCSQNFNASPNTVLLTASGANTYTWTLPPAYTAAPNLNNPAITLTPSISVVTTVANITVTGSSGSCTNSAVYTVTVIPNPIIAVTSGSMCAGKSVTLTAMNATTYTWTPAATLNTGNGPVVVASPAVTTVYSVIGSSVGCNSQTQNATATVVVNPTVTILPNPAVICLGNSINLTASGAATYTWSPNVALTTTLGPNTTANPITTTTYSVLGSQATCTNVGVITVTVLGLPSVTVTPSSPTLCMNNFNGSPNTVSLTASGAATYTWGPITGVTTNTLNGPVIIGTSNGAPVITGTVIGANGTCTNMATFTLNAIPNPTIAVTSASMCAGKTATLFANNATTYTWSPAASLNTANAASVIASPSVTTVYSVIGSSAGCNSQTQNGIVTVVPNPTITIVPALPVICLGNSINLTANGAATYTWSPNIALTTTNVATTSANPTITTTYTVLGSQATCTNIGVVTVTVLGLPSVTITPSSPTLCMNNFNGSPNTVSLTASGAATYTWGPIIGLTTNTLNGSMVIGTSNGAAIATGTVIGANGTCTNMATFTVNAVPNPTITVTSGSMCAGTSVVLTANNASTYTWTPGASLNVSNGPSVIASPFVTTIYSVIGSSAGCNSQTQNGTATVVANPTVNIAPLTPTICFGNSIALIASGATTYSWSPNIAITATTGANVTVNPTITTTYSLIGSQSTCTNSTVRTVTVINLPVVNINLSSPVMCMNNFNGSSNTVNITATGATTYTWTGFNGVTANTTSGAFVIGTAVPNIAIGSGTVIGFIGTCSNVASFTVAEIPNPIISVPSASMCFGTSVVLNASGASTYLWAPSNSLSSPFGSSVTASPGVTTVYGIIGTSLNCNSPTQISTVIVVPNPVISIAPVNPTICAGSSIGLVASGAATYTWSPGNTLDNTTNANVNASPMITTNYTVIGTLATCTSSAVRQVIAIPLPTLQAICNPSAICEGDKTTINANGASSYTWSPAASLSDAYSNFVTANPAVSTVYSLIGNNGLCTTTISVPVNVIAKPLLNLFTNNPKICIGQNSTIFASGAEGYSWTPAGNITNTTSAIVSPSVTTNYTVTGYNYSGTVACPFTKEIEIEIVPQVTASISNSVAICQGESVKLNAGGSDTYVWTPAAGLNNSLTPTPYANPSSTTVYTVMVSTGGFCGTTGTVLVKVNPQPTVEAGPDLIFNSDEPMYLTATGTGTLTWIFGNGILCSVCPNTQIMPSGSGVYKIQAINEFGCIATDDVNVEVTNDYNIYIPNVFTPNSDGLNDVFLVYGTGISKVEMYIFDRWGAKLFYSNDQLKGWDGIFKGQECKQDVYTYLVNFIALDNSKHTKTGHVTLMK